MAKFTLNISNTSLGRAYIKSSVIEKFGKKNELTLIKRINDKNYENYMDNII